MNLSNISRISNNFNNTDGSLNNQKIKRLDSIKSKSSKDVDSADSFFRKNAKAQPLKKEVLTHENLIRIMRSDIIEIDALIKSYSDVHYKINAINQNLFPSFIQKKISDLEDKQNIKTLLEGINTDSFDITKLLQIYKCEKESDLIGKLSHAITFYEIFINKLNDFSFVLSLRFFNDLNDSKLYQDTHSKLFYIRNVIEKLLERYKDSGEEKSVLLDDSLMFADNVTHINNLNHNHEAKIMECSNVFDFLNLDSESSLINHIKLLINNNLNEVKKDFEDLVGNYGDANDLKSISGHNYKEVFIKEKLVLGKIICDKVNEIDELKKKSLELENIINESKNLINYSDKDQKDPEKDNPKILSLLKILEVNFKTISNFKNIEENVKIDFYEEIKELTTKNTILNDKLATLTKEYDSFKSFTQKQVKASINNIDLEEFFKFQSEQFYAMKNAFLDKIETLNRSFVKVKIDSRKIKVSMQNDLNQEIFAKQLFIKQLSEIKKKYI